MRLLNSKRIMLMVVALCVINTGLFAESPDTTRYDKRIHHYRKNWESLIPTQLILQTCGNMGLFPSE